MGSSYHNYINSSKTPSVFSNSEDEDEDQASVIFSHSSTLSVDQLVSPQRRTSSMSNEQAKAIIFSAYNESKKHKYHPDHQPHSQLHSISSQTSNLTTNTTSSSQQPKNTLYHIRLTTDDDSFKTILRKDVQATVGEVIDTLQKKYNLGEIMISMEDGDNVAKHLNHHDKIVRLQNRILKINYGVDDEDLPNACLGKNNSFKFLIHRL